MIRKPQSDLFELGPRPADYKIHYHPPVYPDGCFPSRCRHDPQFVMCANVELVPRRRGGHTMEIDHSMCLACGLPQPCTIGGNVLVDCQMILTGKAARHWRIYLRVQQIRDKWSRIATYLFDENGWNGRHEQVARLIDPNLTMKFRLEPISGTTKQRMGTISFDNSYLRPN